jgi:formate-dependent nitrite reductase membrane component NrfD
MTELDLSRHSPLLDPSLHVWGWEIPAYLFLGGMAAGAMMLLPLLAARAGPASRWSRWLGFAVPLLVTVGMGALLLDLEHKLHVYRFYLAFRWTSPMSWGAWILLLVYPVSLLWALSALGDEEAAALARRAGPLGRLITAGRDLALPRRTALRWASLVVGLGLGVYTGILLSVLGARSLWASPVLGPLFLASGVSSGAALLALFPLEARERRWLGGAHYKAMAAEAILLLLFALGHATGGAAGRAALAGLVSGPYALAFWGLVVGCGLGLPLAVEVAEARARLRHTALAPALVLVGGLALRWVLVAAGQA